MPLKVISVIPISKGIGKEALSYFTSLDLLPGTMITVPLRKRMVPALVLSSDNASEHKAELKRAPFELKKIGKSKAGRIFSQEFIKTAREAADYFATTTGSVLDAVTPKAIVLNPPNIESAVTRERAPVPERYVLQSDDEERFANYKSLIREEFAQKRSVFFCLPTIQDIKNASELLERGIEKYTFVLHGTLTKNEQGAVWKEILALEHPLLIIATPSFLGIPRGDLGAIIVEKENSKAYKREQRPHLDMRTFAELYAKNIKAKFILGDLLLRTETYGRGRSGEYLEFAPLKSRSLTTAEQEIVDMKKYKEYDEKMPFRILSDELKMLVARNRESNGNLFIFAARRGLAPSTVCGDCGAVITCDRCSSPIVLHRAGGKNFFLCHKCGERVGSEIRCKNCESWKLTTLGVGIELVERELGNEFPDIKFFRMDKDNIPTHKKALEMAEKFYNTPGSVLIGTEMALPYLTRKIENAAVVSVDSLFSIPDFRINEKVMSILLKMRVLATKHFLIQTRHIKQAVFDYAIKGNLLDFFREEIELRKKFNFPPFSTLIKVSARGDKNTVTKNVEMLKGTLEEYQPEVFPAFISTVRGQFIMNALIRIPRESWVDETLKEKLLSLPPSFSVDIDPESLL
ncbi:MAG: primosomal protein N' [bacterium]|nr:primosomal protein N' [bacterium]